MYCLGDGNKRCNVWCSLASAAVVSATMASAAVVGAVVIGTAEEDVPSGVLYGAVLV